MRCGTRSKSRASTYGCSTWNNLLLLPCADTINHGKSGSGVSRNLARSSARFSSPSFSSHSMVNASFCAFRSIEEGEGSLSASRRCLICRSTVSFTSASAIICSKIALISTETNPGPRRCQAKITVRISVQGVGEHATKDQRSGANFTLAAQREPPSAARRGKVETSGTRPRRHGRSKQFNRPGRLKLKGFYRRHQCRGGFFSFRASGGLSLRGLSRCTARNVGRSLPAEPMQEPENISKEHWRIRLSICEAAIDGLARKRIELTDPDEIKENDRLTREAFRGADFARKSLAAALRRAPQIPRDV